MGPVRLAACCAVLTLAGCSAASATSAGPTALPTGGTALASVPASVSWPAPGSASPDSTSPDSAAPEASPHGSSPVDSATPDPSTPAPIATPAPTRSPAPGPAVVGVVAHGLLLVDATSAIRRGVFALGDSFLLGSTRTLTASHIRVDAVVGRQFFQGIPELRGVVRTGTLPRNVVVHLGTNGTVTSKHCDSMVATAGPARRVFLVTVIGPRSWMAPDDRVLKACAARHRQQVVVVDWAAVSAPHPNWFGPDRVHPNPTGRRHYNALILAALREYAI